jgi:hypothetical protein
VIGAKYHLITEALVSLASFHFSSTRPYLHSRLTCHKHIFAKQKQLGINLTKMYWLLWREPELATSNKRFIYVYKTILKPIWTYIIQLRGTAEHIQHRHCRVFPIKSLAPWYVPNTVIRRDLQIPTVKEEIRRCSSQYSARLNAHPNDYQWTSLSYKTTGDCEDSCQIACIPDT